MKCWPCKGVRSEGIRACIFLLLGMSVAPLVNSQAISNLEVFDRLAAKTGGNLRVIVQLQVPERTAARNQSLIGNGQWVTLGNYIEEAQDRFAEGMGWRNVNDLVKFKTVPAIAKNVSRSDMKAMFKSSAVQRVYEDTPERLSLHQSTSQIRLPYASKAGYRGQNTAIAILDSGVDSEHPFLSGRVVAELCFSAAGSCPNRATRMFGRGAGAPCALAECSHGTHVAGISAGSAKGLTGVAPGADIIAVQVLSVDSEGTGAFPSDQMQALEWLLINGEKYGVAAINMSLGGAHSASPCDDDPRKVLIDRLRAAGIATIIASGNEHQTLKVGRPGCISSAVTVGALDKQNRVASYSNSYQYLDIMAPGGDASSGQDGGIYSSVPNRSFEHNQGTSMAAPHVAGAWAVFRSAYPSASVDDIERAMLRGAILNRDPRNGLEIPTLDVQGTLQRLAQSQAGSGRAGRQPSPAKPQAPATQKPAPAKAESTAPEPVAPQSFEPTPAPEKCSKRVDGILVEDTTGKCAKQPMQW